MQKKFILPILSLFVFIIISSVSLHGQELEKSVFWKISGKGLKKDSYLFGTIHIMPKKDYKSFGKVEKTLAKSDLFILEMDFDVPMKEQLRWAQMMMLPDGKTLEDLLPEDDFQSFKSIMLDSFELKESKFNKYIRFKPFAMYSLVLVELIGKIESYELNLSKIAKKKDVETYGLETFDFQLAIFDSISYPEQIDMFFKPGMEKEFDDIIALYQEKDIEKMASMISQDEYVGYEENLLTKRNFNWVPKIIEQMQKGQSVFVAVGAAHLAGENGLIELLRKEGYKVEAVKIK